MPKFNSREEETAWFDKNREQLIDLVLRHGKVMPPRQVAATQLLTMRIPVTDIEQARKIAEKEGVGYQTVLKRAIRQGLKHAV
jgi:predicted DNA binding CopG/RHH family protein